MGGWRALGLLLADGRLPAGGHAHSNAMEQAVDEEIVVDIATLEDFLRGRLATSGRVDAHAAAMACRIAGDSGPSDTNAVADALELLDAELDARMASAAARSVSRRQGGQYLRTVREILSDPRLEVLTNRFQAPHLAITLGVAATCARLDATEAARIAAYSCVVGPSTAAVRLLGLDPSAAVVCVAHLMDGCDDLAEEAGGAHSNLPLASAPVLDWLAEAHHTRKERLFAS
ncbi:MAG: urease accessory protein [Acidimicrobiaceae bacterium]|nr:urease accessory protein [Acidimicrobiaceae bacterium]